MSEELKPCPFCGGKMYLSKNDDADPNFQLRCESIRIWGLDDKSKCCANPNIFFSKKEYTEDAIIKIWNNRPIEDALHGIIDGQKVIISELEQQLAELRKANEPRPMSEAPRDGTNILVFDKVINGYEKVMFLNDEFVTTDWEHSITEPSYWLPLPPVKGE